MPTTAPTSPPADECEVPAKYAECRFEFLAGYAAGLRGDSTPGVALPLSSPMACLRMDAYAAGRWAGRKAGRAGA